MLAIYCRNNSDLTHLWVDDGFSRCFMDTLLPSVCLLWILVLGFGQIVFYKRYSIDTDHRFINTTPFLYGVQILVNLLLFLESVSKFLTSYLYENIVYLSDILPLSLCVGWLISLYLIVLERRKMLPSIPTRGHGVILLVFWAVALMSNLLIVISWKSPQWWFERQSASEIIEFSFWVSRVTLTLLALVIGLKAPGFHQYSSLNNANEDQTEALLQDDTSSRSNRNRSAWAGFFQKCKLIWPFIWPKNNCGLQFRVLICFLILAAGRGVNLLVPLFYKEIVNSLTFAQNSGNSTITSEAVLTVGKLQFRYDLILLYVLLKFLQGGGFGSMGLLNNMRTFLWIRVQQYTTKEVSVDLYNHLHSLSLRWHLTRKTGEVLRIMDRGTSSINSILSTVVFNLLPTVVDIVIAIVFFIAAFNAWFGLITFVSMFLYLLATVGITEWRTKYRREMNILDNKRNQKGVDSLLNFETVKYYGAEQFEVDQYREAITDYQRSEWVTLASLNLLNTAQNVIITSGLLAGTLLCAYYVVEGWSGFTVGDFVLFATYIIQLYGPLNFFGTFYRLLQSSFVDMENMFDLLKEEQEVKDVPGAEDLKLQEGVIEFRNVHFHYQPEKPLLKGIDFTVPAGKTVALVGESGAGKSTIVRLLFRFYDIQQGGIYIDGQNIAAVTQNSLRRQIGVVPQDTVLFNADIGYNIRYGRTNASEDDVIAASEAADIHHKILGFPDRYNTVVGERGLKLSGGEKQRVAIARTILKAPNIILLDEATSALDTQTERNIQASLARICENRTSIVVAHRLSTIIHADEILVVKDGEIIERGRHEDLLDQRGTYSDMWHQQLNKIEVDDESLRED